MSSKRKYQRNDPRREKLRSLRDSSVGKNRCCRKDLDSSEQPCPDVKLSQNARMKAKRTRIDEKQREIKYQGERKREQQRNIKYSSVMKGFAGGVKVIDNSDDHLSCQDCVPSSSGGWDASLGKKEDQRRNDRTQGARRGRGKKGNLGEYDLQSGSEASTSNYRMPKDTEPGGLRGKMNEKIRGSNESRQRVTHVKDVSKKKQAFVESDGEPTQRTTKRKRSTGEKALCSSSSPSSVNSPDKKTKLTFSPKQGKKKSTKNDGHSKCSRGTGGRVYNPESSTTQRREEKSTNSSPSGPCGDLPGFYYDPDKKMYFRIQGSQFSKVEHTVTRETINRKQREEKRCKDLTTSAGSTSTHGKIRKKVVNRCFSCLYDRLLQGDIAYEQFRTTYLHSRLSGISLQPSSTPIVVKCSAPLQLEHSIQLERNKNCDKILGLYSTRGSLLQRIQLYNVQETRRTEENPKLSLQIQDIRMMSEENLLSNNYYKVSSMTWADQMLHPEDLCILYTVVSYVQTSNEPSCVTLHTLYSPSGEQRVNPIFPMGNKYIWSCSWDKFSNSYSVGSEKCTLVIDSITRKMWEFHTDNSDVFSQVFAGKGRRCLYSGTRSGRILSHDLRSRSTYPVSRISMSSSVSSLRMLEDGIHLLASDVKGKICLWDLRMIRSCVNEYRGSYNVYSRIPIHVEENLGFVYGADLNGYTRLWKLSDGELLRTIPPPVPTDIETIPTVLYSENWGNRPGNSGLLMGIGNKIYLYPT